MDRPPRPQAPARRGVVRQLTKDNRLGVIYQDCGLGGTPQPPRTFLGGLTHGFHSAPRLPEATGYPGDEVIVIHEKDSFPSTAVNTTASPGKLPILAPAESALYHPIGARILVNPTNDGNTAIYGDAAGMVVAITAGTKQLSITGFGAILLSGHMRHTGALPTVATRTAAGVGATISISGATSSDHKGRILLGTGTSPTAGVVGHLTFHTPYVAVPGYVAIGGAGPDGAALLPYWTNLTTAGFDFGLAVAPLPGTFYVLSYYVEE